MREILHAWRDFFIDAGNFTCLAGEREKSVQAGDSLSAGELEAPKTYVLFLQMCLNVDTSMLHFFSAKYYTWVLDDVKKMLWKTICKMFIVFNHVVKFSKMMIIIN